MTTFIPFPPPTSTSATQACAVPYRREHGQIEFCIITSTNGRWLFPKGFIDPGDSPYDTALKEAYEEAGLSGQIVGTPLGCYWTPKNGDVLTVVALLMEVHQTDDSWAEESFRQRRWVTEDEAIELLGEPYLIDLLKAAMDRIATS
jgi:8-oxo-dGTP pyrophosphatase MutT (NUDIX family)